MAKDVLTKDVQSSTLQLAVPRRTEIEEAIIKARQKGISAIDLLIDEQHYTEEGLAEAFALWLKLPRVRIASLNLDPEAANVISEKVALKHVCLPLKIEGGRVVVAMANPADLDALQDVQFVSGLTAQPVIATRAEIMDGIQELYGTEDRMRDLLQDVEDDGSEVTIVTDDSKKVDLDDSDARNAAETGPVVKMCNLILQEALRSGASDVHMEPALNCLHVRMRVDGVLREYIDVPKWLNHPLASRFKILAELDIAERRLPQDGRMKVKFQNRSMDIRASTLPTHFGEKIVLRVLGAMEIPTVESLGLTEWQFSALTEALAQPQGTILLTGPTGSGKTTTLYSMISRRRSPELNIVTVEDPVEYQLAGINQVQVHIKAGLTFAASLRSILRQDPDVILIGEIRDLDTAEIAFQASITGHLVLSTLHANSSAAVVTRLMDLGLDPFVVSSSLRLVVAQRLARRICKECKEQYVPPAETLEKLHLTAQSGAYYRGRGCHACGNTGYAGRVGIYEIIKVTNTIRELIRQKASEKAIRKAAAATGSMTLLEDGVAKVLSGATSVDELCRVIELETEETYPCPNCKNPISGEFKSCPFCMDNLRLTCGSCGQDLKAEWRMCPYCATVVQTAPEKAEITEPEQAALTSGATSNSLSPSPVARPSLPAVKRPRILVVDDDPGILKIISLALKQLPIDSEVMVAADGVEALDAVETKGADLVILDVMMPRMDGFAVCDKLRKDIKTAFLPVLMLTANADQTNRTKGYLVGTDDYMSKPFDVNDFLARVTRLLRRTYGL